MSNMAIWCCCVEGCILDTIVPCSFCSTSGTPKNYKVTPNTWPTLSDCMDYVPDLGSSDDRDTGLFWDAGTPATGDAGAFYLDRGNCNWLKTPGPTITEGVYAAGTDCLTAVSSSSDSIEVDFELLTNTTARLSISVGSALGADYLLFRQTLSKPADECLEIWNFTANELTTPGLNEEFPLVTGATGGSFTIECGNPPA